MRTGSNAAEPSTTDREDVGRVLVSGIVLASLAWIDPLFMPLVLLGPIATGIAWGFRQESWRGPAATWTVAGAGMLVSDWAINNEDQLFHVVLTLLMVGILRVAHLVAALFRRRRV